MELNLNEIINQLLSVTEVLASKVFRLAVQQVAVDAILYGVTALIALVSLIAAMRTAVPYIKTYWSSKYTDNFEDLTATIYHAWLIISALLFYYFSMSAFSYTANPEWFAIRMLLETFVK